MTFKFILLGGQNKSPNNRYQQQKQQKTTAACTEHACLPPAECKPATLPPRSSSRQHHARLAGPPCVMPSYFYQILRSITRPHRLVHLSTAAACCALSYHTSTGQPIAHNNRQQLTASHTWVRQVRAVLSLVPFIGACDRSPDHTTTSAARCV